MSERYKKPGCFITFALPLGGLLAALTSVFLLLG